MLLIYNNEDMKEIGVAFVGDNDAEVLEAVGYCHCVEEDFEKDKTYVEVWKSIKT